MTAKILRTTTVIALTAFSVTALCAASPSVRAEPGEPMRIAQKADDPNGEDANAANKNPDGKKGDRPRRNGNRPDRGDGKNPGGGDGDGTKKNAKPDAAKANQPKIINKPKSADKAAPPPALKPPAIKKPVVDKNRPPAPPVVKKDVRPPAMRPPDKTAAPPSMKKPVMPGMTAPPRIAEPPVKQFTPPRKVDTARPVPVVAKPAVKNLNDAKQGRVERREQGGNRVVIKEADKRTIVRQGNKIVIQKDESAQLRRMSPNAVVTRDRRGRDKTVVRRRDNTEVVTETDRNGQLLRRYRRDRDGRETIIIDNRRRKDNFGRNLAIGVGVGAGIIAGAAILNSVVDVPPPRVRVPRDKYIVDYERASEEDVYEALNAPPVDEIDRGYTLDQVRATPHLRERMRRVDLDDITFETGSWDIDPSQYRKLERIARAMRRVIARNPNEVFLIEGYTDAVGSEVDNLTLSDRRAEAVSVVLSEEFEVPFENLTTQGYGEEYLKIPTDGPERINRRVAARRITPLLNHDNISAAPPPPPPGQVYDRDEDEEPPRYRRWRRYN